MKSRIFSRFVCEWDSPAAVAGRARSRPLHCACESAHGDRYTQTRASIYGVALVCACACACAPKDGFDRIVSLVQAARACTCACCEAYTGELQTRESRRQTPPHTAAAAATAAVMLLCDGVFMVDCDDDDDARADVVCDRQTAARYQARPPPPPAIEER